MSAIVVSLLNSTDANSASLLDQNIFFNKTHVNYESVNIHHNSKSQLNYNIKRRINMY